ncbi:hypothetical protein AAG906_018055 [Vitis piasezkii]
MASFFTTLPKTPTLTLVSSSQSKPNPKKAKKISYHRSTNQTIENKISRCRNIPLKLKLSSIWTILIVFEDPIPIPFERDIKLLHSLSSGPHCWTFFNKTTFGKRNKVPQENIPTVTTEKMKEAMLAGIPCIFYPHGRANICDDWLMGSSLEAVSLNNITLANHGKLVSQLYIDS